MRYTLRQLEIFLAVAYYENITRAASSLFMSQSAASSALQDLEKQFDIQLFDRIGKRLQLNDLGKVLRPRAEELLARSRELERVLSQEEESGPLKVGATLTIGNYLAVGIMSKFMEQHPESRVSLEVANTSEIVRKVSNFELDIGLIEGEEYLPELDIIPWMEDELQMFCSPEDNLAEKKNLNDQDLINARWILREQGSGTRQAFERGLHDLLGQINIILELQHTEAIKRAVEANLGIACLSRICLKDAFRRGSLVPLKVPHRNLHRQFYFILHKHKYRSAGIECWMDLCREMLA